eukprot:GILI01025850.1.p1 GENE.GILI01025850.1~~GILI01025850.1.p1  ORF type:complete len:219 (-),score=77.85 GILI01025850.1:89-685(-)
MKFDITAIDNKLKKISLIDKLATMTKLPHLYIGAGLVAFVILFLLFGFGAGAVTNLVGFVYPVYMSFKAIESPGEGDDKQWLTYWVVYGFLTTFESFFSFLLHWIPFYHAGKLALLFFCFYNNGASQIYQAIVKPWFMSHQAVIEESFDQVKKLGEEAVSGVVDIGKEAVTANAGALMGAAMNVVAAAGAAAEEKKNN